MNWKINQILRTSYFMHWVNIWSILVQNIFLYQSPLQKERESTFCRNYRKKGSFRWILWIQNTLIRAYSQMLVSSPISFHHSHIFFISFSNYIIEPNILCFFVWALDLQGDNKICPICKGIRNFWLGGDYWWGLCLVSRLYFAPPDNDWWAFGPYLQWWWRYFNFIDLYILVKIFRPISRLLLRRKYTLLRLYVSSHSQQMGPTTHLLWVRRYI